MNKYDEIINLDFKLKHQRMSIRNRSAQFAPFSALTGYSELINEKGRETTKKIDLSIDDQDKLDYKLQLLKEKMNEKIEITIKYFIKDIKKDGGKYEEVTDILKKIDFTKKYITLNSNLKIKISDILDITSQDINFDDLSL